MSGRLVSGGLILLLALLLGLGLWTYLSLEWTEQEIDLGYGEQAQANPFLGASLFLAAQGVGNEVHRGFAPLDHLEQAGPYDTLILIDGYRTLGPGRLERVWQWVEGGGHLILSAQNRFIGSDGGARDPVFGRLGVELYAAETEAPPESWAPQGDDPCQEKGQLTRIHFTDQPRLLCIEMLSDLQLVDSVGAATAWAGSAGGAQLLQFNVGEGLVTLTTDNRIWSNPRIAAWDHAYLLWLFGRDNRVWMLYNRDAPALWRLLWDLSPWGMTALGLALGLWLWHRSVRFGPVCAPPALHRRRFLDHTDASARFLWQRRQAGQLLEPLRAEILNRMEHRHRNFRTLPRERQLELLTRVSGLPPQQLLPALYQEAGRHEQAFFRQVRDLQRIRNQL